MFQQKNNNDEKERKLVSVSSDIIARVDEDISIHRPPGKNLRGSSIEENRSQYSSNEIHFEVRFWKYEVISQHITAYSRLRIFGVLLLTRYFLQLLN
jgi:hypothetical protein